MKCLFTLGMCLSLFITTAHAQDRKPVWLPSEIGLSSKPLVSLSSRQVVVSFDSNQIWNHFLSAKDRVQARSLRFSEGMKLIHARINQPNIAVNPSNGYPIWFPKYIKLKLNRSSAFKYTGKQFWDMLPEAERQKFRKQSATEGIRSIQQNAFSLLDHVLEDASK
jgi:hypothetical protein